jgi:hypothetical protein
MIGDQRDEEGRERKNKKGEMKRAAMLLLGGAGP